MTKTPSRPKEESSSPALFMIPPLALKFLYALNYMHWQTKENVPGPEKFQCMCQCCSSSQFHVFLVSSHKQISENDALIHRKMCLYNSFDDLF